MEQGIMNKEQGSKKYNFILQAIPSYFLVPCSIFTIQNPGIGEGKILELVCKSINRYKPISTISL